MNRETMEQMYEQLRARYDARELTIDQVRTELLRAKIRDSRGRFWMIDPETGNWIVNAGGAWIEGTPPPELSAQQQPADWLQGLRSAGMPTEGEPSTHAPARPTRKKRLSKASMALILIVMFVVLALVFCALGAVLTNGFGIVDLGLG